MKKYVKIAREFPAAAVLCFIADIIVTSVFTKVSLYKGSPDIVTYFITLYGTFMGILIFTGGCVTAKERAEKKAAERLRRKRRQLIVSAYAREFYGITEKSS